MKGAKYGSGQGTVINAFCCMKSGVKNYDSNGNAGPIPERAKQLVDDYNAAIQKKYPDNWQEQPFDGKIAYDIGGGMSHGRLAIVNGVVKKALIVDAAKAGEIRPTTSRSYQSLWRRYEEQVANNRHLTEQNVVLTRRVQRADRILELICDKVQLEIPPDLCGDEDDMRRGTRDGSSHASVSMDSNINGHE